MKNKYIFGLVCYTSWCGLGFVRGVNSHIYSHNKYDSKDPVIYSYALIDGFFGVIMYANPILIPLAIHKEIYRLEVNVRNLENDKKGNYYNDLL